MVSKASKKILVGMAGYFVSKLSIRTEAGKIPAMWIPLGVAAAALVYSGEEYVLPFAVGSVAASVTEMKIIKRYLPSAL